MKITLNQIIEGMPIFKELANCSLKFQTSYKVVKLLKVYQENSEYYISQAQNIAQKYGEENESGELVSSDGTIFIPEENRLLVQKEFDELNSVEVDIPDITFTPDEFIDVNMTPLMVEVLMPYLN